MGFMFELPFNPPTPEQIKEMEDMANRRQIMSEEFRHAVQRLFEELPEDQLDTLKAMLIEITHHDELAPQWLGMASMALKMRFNVCVTCGVNHDKELQIPEAPAAEPKLLDELADDDVAEAEAQAYEAEIMKRYHLEDVRDEDTHEFLYYRCTGIKGTSGPCGVTYPSLTDRMLKGPEKCSGCFQRMAHG